MCCFCTVPALPTPYFTEDVIMTTPYDVRFKGAYTNESFNALDPANDTVIDGSLKIQKGTLRVERVKIK
jgi:hypothetical protein